MTRSLLYETLITRDCEGELSWGLADRWKPLQRGKAWAFCLRDGLCFWDGSPVDSWKAAELLDRAAAEWPGVDSVAADPSRSGWIVVYLRTARADPAFLADPLFALQGPPRPDGIPMGTGPYAPASGRTSGESSGGLDRAGRPNVHPQTFILAPNPIHPSVLRSLSLPPPVLEIVWGPDHDPRDWADRGFHLLSMRDRTAVDYYRSVSMYSVLPMPADRRYILESAVPVPDGFYANYGPGLGGGPTSERHRQICRELANLTLRAEAEEWAGPAAAPPGTTPAILRAGGVRNVGPPHVLLYPSWDPDARRLAERLAARIGGGGLPVDPADPPWIQLLAHHAPAPLLSRPGPGESFRGGDGSGTTAVAWIRIQEDGPDPEAGLSPDAGLDPVAGAAPGDQDRASGDLLQVPLLQSRGAWIARRDLGGLRIDGSGFLRLAHGDVGLTWVGP